LIARGPHNECSGEGFPRPQSQETGGADTRVALLFGLALAA